MTEVKAAAGAGMSGGLQEEILGFVKELKAFRDDIGQKLQEQDKRMTMLDRKTALRGRAPLSTRAEVGVPHQKAFNAYLRHGDDDGLRGLVLEEKGMTTVSDGGFLAAPQVADQVQDVLSSKVSLRAVANVVRVESAAYEVLVDMGDIASGWATEDEAVEPDTPTVERVVIPVHELSAMPKASQRLLDDAAFDIEAWLAGRIAEKFARAEAAAFINGDGIDKPRGLLTYPSAPNNDASANEIGLILSGSEGDFSADDPATALIDLVYALAAEYRTNASFIMCPRCSAVLGDEKCAMDLTRPGYFAEANVLSHDGARLLLDGVAGHEPGWFEQGRLLVLSGEGEGLHGRIKNDRALSGGQREIELWAALGTCPAVGDRLRLTAGCDKSSATCRAKFGNFLNFRGFPHLPTEDWLLTPQAETGRRR